MMRYTTLTNNVKDENQPLTGTQYFDVISDSKLFLKGRYSFSFSQIYQKRKTRQLGTLP